MQPQSAVLMVSVCYRIWLLNMLHVTSPNRTGPILSKKNTKPSAYKVHRHLLLSSMKTETSTEQGNNNCERYRPAANSASDVADDDSGCRIPRICIRSYWHVPKLPAPSAIKSIVYLLIIAKCTLSTHKKTTIKDALTIDVSYQKLWEIGNRRVLRHCKPVIYSPLKYYCSYYYLLLL